MLVYTVKCSHIQVYAIPETHMIQAQVPLNYDCQAKEGSASHDVMTTSSAIVWLIIKTLIFSQAPLSDMLGTCSPVDVSSHVYLKNNPKLMFLIFCLWHRSRQRHDVRVIGAGNWKHVVLFIIEASSDLRHTAAPLVEHAQSECAVGKHGGSHEYDRKYRLFCHFSTLYIDEVHF